MLTQEIHLTLSLRLQNEPSVLSRIALVFSRRRLRIQAMQFLDLQQDSSLAELQVDLTCEPFMARLLSDQLERIVEVSSVSSEIRSCGAMVGTPSHRQAVKPRCSHNAPGGAHAPSMRGTSPVPPAGESAA